MTKVKNAVRLIRSSGLLLASLVISQPLFAEPLKKDCALRNVPFSSSLPAYDIMTRPKARAIVEQYYPELFSALPSWLLSEEMPSFGTIITLDQLMARAGLDGDEHASSMRNALAALPVTDADKTARCARFDVKPVHFTLGDEPVQVLIFQKITGYDHGDSVTAAAENLSKLATDMGYGVTTSDKGSAFTKENLSHFDVVIWNNVSGDALTLTQRKVFEDYMNNGGGFLGLHASAGDSVYFWDWYKEKLIGAQFIGHPQEPNWFQTATLNAHSHQNNLVAGIPEHWELKDEWYSFDKSVSEKHYDVVISIDENSYSPGKTLAMGDDHPLVWSHCVGKGRAMYSAIGHRKEVYDADNYIRLLKNGLQWTSGQGEDSCR